MAWSTSALAQDAPKNKATETHKTAIGAVDKPEKAKATPQANTDKSANKLPKSDIELPKAPIATASAKKALSEKVAAILHEKWLRNTNVGIRVVDLDSGDVVYEHNGDKWLKPASNTKLVTTAAALSLLGADHQFESALVTKGKIENGVLNGDLQLHIDHDFSWGIRFYDTGDVPLKGLIYQLKQAGVKKVNGKIIVSGYVIYGGTPTGTLAPEPYLVKVSQVFAKLLKENQITYNSMDVRQNAKRDGKALATWKSPVLSEMIVPLNRASHNEYADMLLMAIGSKVSGKSSYAAGVTAVKNWLQKNSLPLKGFSMHDGSGLSHDNRMSPEFFTSLVSLILNHSAFSREWAASMSIAGYDGTFSGRLTTDDAKGHVYAKSGTLRDTISSSGFFINKIDGHTYAFSIIVNDMRNKRETRIAVDRIVRVFMSNHLNIKKPASPEFTSFKKEADGRVMARWNEVKGALGYRVYSSTDGAKWQVAAETKDLALTMPDSAAHLRLTAVTETGAESLPSLIFSYRPGKQTMTIIDEAKCRSDEALRPANHFIAHERPLAAFVDKSWGVETVKTPKDTSKSAGILYHSAACNNSINWTAQNYQQVASPKIPVIVNVAEAHLSEGHNAPCAPAEGRVLGCFNDPVVTMDRRIGERAANNRLRKAAGTFSAKPSSVATWDGSKSILEMAALPVAAQSKNKEGGSVTIIGFDLQAVDSQKSLDAFWKKIMTPEKSTEKDKNAAKSNAEPNDKVLADNAEKDKSKDTAKDKK